MCVILGNLLDNALRSCQDTGPHAWVRVVPEAQRQRLIIVVDNTAPTPPQEQGGALLSSRHEGLGIGTQSVCDIAARYGGVAKFKWEAAVMPDP